MLELKKYIPARILEQYKDDENEVMIGERYLLNKLSLHNIKAVDMKKYIRSNNKIDLNLEKEKIEKQVEELFKIVVISSSEKDLNIIKNDVINRRLERRLFKNEYRVLWKMMIIYIWIMRRSTISFKKVKNVADDFLYHYGSLHRGSGINSKKSTDSYENAREKILSFLDGTKEDCVIFTNNTTDSINKFALIYPFEKNDVVLTSDIEHTSNYLPWLKHAKVQLLKTNDFKIEPRNVEKELIENKNIKIVALTWASNITGYISEIKNIYRICKKYNVLLFIDASQYSPHHKPTLKYCDFIAYCGHKMYAPYGSGVLAGNKEILKNDRYSLTGGGNVIYIGENGQVYYKEVPYMHEAGTPNGLGAVALACAHEVLFKDIGINRLESIIKICLML